MGKVALTKKRVVDLLLLFLGLTLIASFFSSCSWWDPNVRKQRYFNSATGYFQEGKYPEAAIQLQNAIKIDPDYMDAHYQLAQCYIKLGWLMGAYAELNWMVTLAPKNWKAQLDLGEVLFATRESQQAEDKAKLVLAAEPQNVRAHTLMANAIAALGDAQGALDEMAVAIRIAPNRSSSYLNLANLQVNAKQPAAAEESYKKAITLNPRSSTPVMALGTFYAAQHRLQEAEQQFQHAIMLDPKNPTPRGDLARVYMVDGRENDAVQVLRLAKQALGGNSSGYRILGDFYIEAGKMDKALEEYASLYRDYPRDAQVRSNYLQLLIDRNRLDEATKLNDSILKENPADASANVAKGEILDRQGRANDAIPLFQSALKTDPNNAIGHYNLGLDYAKVGYLQQAQTEWQQAVKLQPNLAPAQEALAQLGLQQNDLDQAEKGADALITSQPTSPGGYNLRAVVEARRGKLAGAEVDLRKAMELAPQDPVAYTRLGEVRAVQNKFPEAEALYDQALSIAPEFAEALSALMQAYALEKKPVNVQISRIHDQITRAPNNSSYFLMLGQAFYGLRDFEKAQAALEKAVGLDRNNVMAFVLLANTQAARGSLAQGIASAEHAVQQNPRDLRANTMLAVLEEKSGNWQKAEDAYQKAMQIDPAYGLGANNLAFLLLEHGGNVDVALSLAQTARGSLPDSPGTADTLAWAYIHKGIYASAVDLLKKALAQTPDNPTYHYHLGAAYQGMRNRAAATAEFRQVLKLAPAYDKSEEIRKRLADLAEED
jgi:tetratricopeptide (TPR) repeat protein